MAIYLPLKVIHTQYLAIIFLVIALEIVVFGYAIAKADDIVRHHTI